MAHTPAPWTGRKENDDNEWTVFKGAEGDETFIAQVTGGLGHESDANAALILSAPDLLVALQEVVYVWLDDSGTDLNVLMESVMLNVEAAISKARGERA